MIADTLSATSSYKKTLLWITQHKLYIGKREIQALPKQNKETVCELIHLVLNSKEFANNIN